MFRLDELVIFLVVVGEVSELKYRRSLDKKLDACVKKWLVEVEKINFSKPF